MILSSGNKMEPTTIPGFRRPDPVTAPSMAPPRRIPTPEFKQRPLTRPNQFQLPQKRIQTNADVDQFLRSEAFDRLMCFIVKLNASVTGKKVKDVASLCEESQSIKSVLTVLDGAKVWIDEIPPADEPQRFGNKSFRVWMDRLVSVRSNLI
jgi:hypothetical protein